MRAAIALLVVLCIGDAAAADFVESKILNVEGKQGVSGGVFDGGVESDPYTEVTLQIGDLKVTGRSFTLTAGYVYLANHPEAMIVGTTVPAMIDKSWLEVKVPPKGKTIKFKIQRMEKLDQ